MCFLLYQQVIFSFVYFPVHYRSIPTVINGFAIIEIFIAHHSSMRYIADDVDYNLRSRTQLYARRNDDNRRILSARYIHTSGYLHKNLRHFTGNKGRARSVRARSGVSTTQSKDISHREISFSSKREEEKGNKSRGENELYFLQEKGETRETRGNNPIKRTLSLSRRCVLHARLIRVVIVDEAPARSAPNASASTRVHPRDTHVRTDEA